MSSAEFEMKRTVEIGLLVKEAHECLQAIVGKAWDSAPSNEHRAALAVATQVLAEQIREQLIQDFEIEAEEFDRAVDRVLEAFKPRPAEVTP